MAISCRVTNRKFQKEINYAIYGDRGMPEYPAKIQDLNLDPQILKQLNLVFIQDSCHMIMVENPEQLSEIIKGILS